MKTPNQNNEAEAGKHGHSEEEALYSGRCAEGRAGRSPALHKADVLAVGQPQTVGPTRLRG